MLDTNIQEHPGKVRSAAAYSASSVAELRVSSFTCLGTNPSKGANLPALEVNASYALEPTFLGSMSTGVIGSVNLPTL